MNSTEFDVVIIGGGVAGLTCAQRLKKSGYNVIVLDKSRGVGGRMATRRISEIRADHGVRYLEPQGEQLQQLIQNLRTQEVAENQLQLWINNLYEFKNNQLQVQDIDQPYYIIPSGMNTVGKILAEGLKIQLNSLVKSLTLTADNTWQCHVELMDKTGSGMAEMIRAKFIVIAIPAPQAVLLLESVDPAVDLVFLNSIQSVEYDPCLTVIAGYSKEQIPDIPEWKAVTFSDDPILAWVGFDSSKRLNPTQPVFVIQSHSNFAQHYLEATDLNPVGKMLIDQAAHTLLPGLETPAWFQIHRWRYAFCRTPLKVSYLTPTTPLPLVCAGDWCGGHQIEGALKSGIDAANWLQTQTHLKRI